MLHAAPQTRDLAQANPTMQNPGSDAGVFFHRQATAFACFACFTGTADVVDREALKPYVRPAGTADAVYAF
jgi:hypothetical protein